MARNLYGCTSADFTLTESGRVVAGATATVWTARTGGTQITDLTDVDGGAITSVTSDADGGIRFYGVDGDKDAYWLDTGTGARIAVRPVDLTGETGPTPELSIGTVTTGTAAATITGTAEEPVLNLTLPSAGANGVNTAAIQNDAVTAAKIAADAVGSSEIAAGAVGTSELADAAVTAAKLGSDVRIGNLLAPNQASGGDTLGTTAGFTESLATIAVETGITAAQGSKCIKVTSTGGTAGMLICQDVAAQYYVPVTPGNWYTFSAWMKSDTITRNAGTQVMWRAANGSAVSTTYVNTWQALTTDWQEYVFTGQAPAGAYLAIPEIVCASTVASEVYYVDKLSFHAGIGGRWAPPGTPVPEVGDSWTIAGALVNEGASDYFQPVDDTEHTPMNIASVATDSSKIRVTYTKGARRVGAVSVTVDEAWAGTYVVGASVGLTFTDIYVKTMAGVAVDPTSMPTNGNIWIHGSMR